MKPRLLTQANRPRHKRERRHNTGKPDRHKSLRPHRAAPTQKVRSKIMRPEGPRWPDQLEDHLGRTDSTSQLRILEDPKGTH